MSHEVQTMAYVGATPWHGLGKLLRPGASIDEWTKEAGMEWAIRSAPIEFATTSESGKTYSEFEGYRVLFRSDTHAPLSVVSSTYKVVQPGQVMEFFRSLVETQKGYVLESAGCLRGGRKVWALAKMRETIELPGKDLVEGYLLMATSCDGSMATSVIPTSIRVVCANTLHATLHGAEGGIRIPHSQVFDARAVQERLQIAREQWEDYCVLMQSMARKSISTKEAIRFFEEALGSFKSEDIEKPATKHKRALVAIKNLYDGGGRGSALPSASGTVWGAVNAISEYADYGRKTRSEDNRLSSAWFGASAQLKQRALEAAVFQL